MNPRFHTIPDHWLVDNVVHEHVWLYDRHAGKIVRNPETAGGQFATDAEAEAFANTLPPVVRKTSWVKCPMLAGFCDWKEYDQQGNEIEPFFISHEPDRYRAGDAPYWVCESGASRHNAAERRKGFSNLNNAKKFASKANAERNGYLIQKGTS